MSGWRRLPVIAALFIALPCAWGQSPRDEYRRNYQAWRQTEPTLEGEAGTATDLAARVQRAWAAARTYVAARIEFLDGIAQEASDQWKRIQELGSAAGLLGVSPDAQDLVTGSGDSVTRVAESFGTAADPGIRQLRTALQQERAALDAISQAMLNTRRAAAAATLAGVDLDAARENLLRAYPGVATARTQAADQMRKSGAAWDAYYAALANPAALLNSNVIAPAKPVSVPKPEATAPPTPGPAATEVSRPQTITPLPLLRYTGGWTFPTSGIFHGTQPQSVELDVREENGRVTGTLSARFAIPARNATEPVVQFRFEGNLTASRNQAFPLRTADGVTGTIELIPGPAFNLLEVNFQTQLLPNRVRHGNFLLVKR